MLLCSCKHLTFFLFETGSHVAGLGIMYVVEDDLKLSTHPPASTIEVEDYRGMTPSLLHEVLRIEPGTLCVLGWYSTD